MAKYVNKPGGVIAHDNTGASITLAYGDEVPDNLADYVDSSTFSDGTKRVATFAEQQALESSQRAALAEGGQVNSSSSPVPGNYSDLTEDGAAQLVTSLDRYPDQQAVILRHELAFGGGRQKVMDAGSQYARIVAGLLIDQAPAAATAHGDVSGDPVVPAPDALSGREQSDGAIRLKEHTDAAAKALVPAPSGSVNEDPPEDKSVDDMNYAEMKAYIDAQDLDVPKNIGSDDMRAAIKAVEFSKT